MAYKSTVNITRPANTTAYTAGDVIGNSTSAGGAVLALGTFGNSSGFAFITGVTLRIDLTAIPSGMTSFRAHLYKSSPGSALADNDAWDLPSGDRSAYLGYIDIGTPADVGSTLFVQYDEVNKLIELNGSAPTTVYGYLVTNGGYTPTSGETMQLTMGGIPL